ncbi:MAG: FAD-dependent oxidoreductase [Desulfovibrio sp.]|jgi:NADPH-dependent 2,4-dienoyl-CoA reductase/sulfur reductase-like enzyme/rhodanese-related sulfurtransferase|nr:FAD-dependent oxidoreductase [Desulfovibrio sp.]
MRGGAKSDSGASVRKVVVVGGMAAGASAAARLRRLDENLEIIVLEKGEYISYASCGLPYYVGRVVEDRKKLIIQSPSSMSKRFHLEVRTGHEALEITPAARTVKILVRKDGREYDETYDRLLLCLGAKAALPDLPGMDMENVFTVNDIPGGDAVRTYVDTRGCARAVIVGAGPVGLEMAEMLRKMNLETHLVDMAGQAMPAFDPDMASFVLEELLRNQVKPHLGAKVARLDGEGGRAHSALLDNGEEIKTDFVLFASGVKPQSGLAERAGLAVGETGGVLVDDYLRTSDPHIYAAGDVIQTSSIVSGNAAAFSAAGPAGRQGWIAANNICGLQIPYHGVQGTVIVKIFNLTAAATGLNEKILQRLGITHQCVHVAPDSHAGYYPGASTVTIKLLFSPGEGRVLGAQLVGESGVDKRADVLSTALRSRLTVHDLQELELAYAPPYSSAKDPVNVAAYAAGNVLRGLTEVVRWERAQEYIEEGAFLLDVRTEKEFSKGAVPCACNIPLDALRERCGELPAGRTILVYCLSGLRSYMAARILRQRGFRACNLSGGWHLYRRLYPRP